MGIQPLPIPFRNLLGFVVVEHAVFALPVLTLLVLFRFIPFEVALFLIAVFSVVVVPTSAGMAYLIAKGSNWVNTRAAVMASGVLPGQIYGLLFGGLVGYHLWKTPGGLIGAIICFGLGSLAGAKVAQYLVEKELPTGVVQS